MPDGLFDFANALANPIKYQSELEKRAKQLSILTGESEDPFDVSSGNLFEPLSSFFLSFLLTLEAISGRAH